MEPLLKLPPARRRAAAAAVAILAALALWAGYGAQRAAGPEGAGSIAPMPSRSEGAGGSGMSAALRRDIRMRRLLGVGSSESSLPPDKRKPLSFSDLDSLLEHRDKYVARRFERQLLADSKLPLPLKAELTRALRDTKTFKGFLEQVAQHGGPELRSLAQNLLASPKTAEQLRYALIVEADKNQAGRPLVRGVAGGSGGRPGGAAGGGPGASQAMGAKPKGKGAAASAFGDVKAASPGSGSSGSASPDAPKQNTTGGGDAHDAAELKKLKTAGPDVNAAAYLKSIFAAMPKPKRDKLEKECLVNNNCDPVDACDKLGMTKDCEDACKSSPRCPWNPGRTTAGGSSTTGTNSGPTTASPTTAGPTTAGPTTSGATNTTGDTPSTNGGDPPTTATTATSANGGGTTTDFATTGNATTGVDLIAVDSTGGTNTTEGATEGATEGTDATTGGDVQDWCCPPGNPLCCPWSHPHCCPDQTTGTTSDPTTANGGTTEDPTSTIEGDPPTDGGGVVTSGGESAGGTTADPTSTIEGDPPTDGGGVVSSGGESEGGTTADPTSTVEGDPPTDGGGVVGGGGESEGDPEPPPDPPPAPPAPPGPPGDPGTPPPPPPGDEEWCQQQRCL
ncbi:MAG: hypothetical protein HY925_09015 [Elusimicrobia bacterium]|nr:hypothetical protein [Elusimicrobiota bacterium]